MKLRYCVPILLFTVSVAVQAQAPACATGEKSRQTWQMLDYIAVDYGSAVANAKVIDADEYAEMREFSAAIEREIGSLSSKPEKAALLQRATALTALIERKAGSSEVAQQARHVAEQLLAAYPFPIAPAQAPKLAQGEKLYQAQCAACHGVQGKGDGKLAAGLKPMPTDFTQRDRAGQRSPLALHQAITSGIAGTAMQGYASLSDEDRWALAFYVSTLAYSAQEKVAGKAQWEAAPALQAKVPGLGALAQLSEAGLRQSGVAQAGPVVAYLRSQPELVSRSPAASIAFSKSRIKESLAAARLRATPEAIRLALAAYLDGFEAVEPALRKRDEKLTALIEKTMSEYRATVTEEHVPNAIRIEARLQELLDQAQQTLAAAPRKSLWNVLWRSD
ncbi:Cytochrome C oxidase, cbb3-type, subunit III [Noviherbaspirillum humi]|uniref:Cytochrome C oxidase, cbb3-type, subunit III n=1 Tax=Noviherbaspirillum humi TaxID=1688639 RepID=A0A239JU42_9BURK|nr:cytochrome c [Noviherbaspirillum humi]SNT09295.1 Cytochrome C oxidase, cbb3-type, subunit III [Noviherbaspirillum humi]